MVARQVGNERTGKPIIPRRPEEARHYHLSETRIGDPLGYRDEVFRNRRQAAAAARSRAEWLTAVADLQLVALTGSGRYLLTTRRIGDPGCLIEVEACEDFGCLDRGYGSCA